jgi:hypothetical protein
MWPFNRKKWEKLGVSVSSAQMFDLFRIMDFDGAYIRDTAYRAIPYKDFDYLMTMKRWPDPDYVKDKFDCDDFSTCFIADIRRAWAELSRGEEALAFGYIEGRKPDGKMHAWIWQLDDALNINFIEPQTNSRLEWTPQKINVIEA